MGGVAKTVVPDESGAGEGAGGVEDESKFLVKNAMQITLSCDHRVMDGVMGANFLNTIKKWVRAAGVRDRYLENPELLLL